jgi:putative ABC transport system permease protein
MSQGRRKMRLSSILRLYRARLRARVVLVQELFAVLGLAVGVALLFASQVASASLNGSVEQFTSGVIGRARLQLVARDPQGFDERLLGAVRHLPGVRVAVPVLEERANVVGANGEERPVDLIAGDPSLVELGGTLLQRFKMSLAGQRVLALPTPLAQSLGTGPLETVELQIGGRDTQALVGTELGAHDIGTLVDSPVVLAPLAYAQQLAGMRGRITRIFVEPQAGRERQVQQGLLGLAAGHLNVEAANSDASFFSQAAGPVNQATTLFSAISALVGFMFAYCAMLLTVPLRRGLVRDLRRDGATRWMTIKTLLFDAIVLGGVASLVGLALGDLLSITLFHSNPGYLSFAFPVGSQRIVTWQTVVLAGGTGLVAACIGVLTPLRDIFSRPLRTPASTPRHERHRWRAWQLGGGLVCLAVSGVVLLSGSVSLLGAIAGIVSLVGALLLLLAPLLDATIALFDWAQSRFSSGSARLAAIELRSPAAQSRSWAIAATGAIAVFASVTIQGATGSLQRGLDRLFGDVTSVADLWVVAPGTQNLLATTPLQDAVGGKLSRLAGVQTVGEYRAGFLDYGERRVWVLAPPATALHPVPPSQLIDGSVATTTARLRAGGWAVLSQVLAAQHHLRIGQSFTLPAPNPMTFRVAALSTNLGWPPGAVILGARDYARAWGNTEPSAYNVTLSPQASVMAVSAEIRRALGPASGLTVETARRREQRQRAASRQGLERLIQIATLVLIAGILAISVAMSALISQRRPQLARMKLEGFSTYGLWRALLLESGLLLGAGCSIGAVFGVGGELLQSHALLAVTGFPVVFSVGPLAAIGSFALVTAAAATIIAVPGYRAANIRPYPAT